MSKESFIHRISKRLGEPESIKPEDIDREVAAAVEAIKAEKTETLDGAEVLSDNRGEAAGKAAKAYIMDMAPIYKIIGGRKGRMAENLRESCEKEFAAQSTNGRDRASIEGNLFLMRFYGLDENSGFAKAATIVNTVGAGILGSRFETLEVPSLLIAADVGDIINEDGSVNMDGLLAAVGSGGVPVLSDKPGDDAPQWAKLRWEEKARGPEIHETRTDAKSKPRAEPAGNLDSNVKRNLNERRKLNARFKGGDRRKSFDRRGRGY
ncbi:MAG TPA: hypothetical protein ENI55_05470 [Alphaproteobacteria bacterium]|nr:hypothetical protein [Alphaproteobacteria bacterium]